LPHSAAQDFGLAEPSDAVPAMPIPMRMHDLGGPLRVYGVDFSSAPSTQKPITAAVCTLAGDGLVLHAVAPLPSLGHFEGFLAHEGPWLAGFDLPFSMPRALIEHFGWPSQSWQDFIRWYAAQPREWLRMQFKAFCAPRPYRSKYVYRRTDKPAGSSPAMRSTNTPVAWMAHAGAARILNAGLHLPGLAHGADASGCERIALEAYPGFTARHVLRQSYKSDQGSKQTAERAQARQQILLALERRRAGLSVALSTSRSWRKKLLDDGSGDLIDAAICALQAAHAARLPRYGFPEDLDSLEGWIASVPAHDGGDTAAMRDKACM
jgi:hypothetical protein